MEKQKPTIEELQKIESILTDAWVAFSDAAEYKRNLEHAKSELDRIKKDFDVFASYGTAFGWRKDVTKFFDEVSTSIKNFNKTRSYKDYEETASGIDFLNQSIKKRIEELEK